VFRLIVKKKVEGHGLIKGGAIDVELQWCASRK